MRRAKNLFSNQIIINAYCCLLLLLLVPSEAATSNDFHTLQLSSLRLSQPSSTAGCSSSVLHGAPPTSSEVRHVNHPCAGSRHGVPKLTTTEILTRDELRVSSIRARVASNKAQRQYVPNEAPGTKLRAQPGSLVGSGNYFVSVGIGNPATTLYLVMDTGSDLTWTQCSPCKICYNQSKSLFHPSGSSTYSTIPCTSKECSQIHSYTGYAGPNCTRKSPRCVYGIMYGDNSASIGNLATERLSLKGSSDTVQNFTFGCGHNQTGLFYGISGLLGLGPGHFSILSQTAQKYGKKFSYCLPTVNGNGGYLKFGGGAAPAPRQKNMTSFTPLTTGSHNFFYEIQMLSISVGGNKLKIDPTVFSKAGTIIDSGTVITRLPPAAYKALKSSVVNHMKNYTRAKPFSLLDTCFDLSNTGDDDNNIPVPKISFEFGGHVKVDIPESGIFFALSANLSQVCLAFAGNVDPTDFGIYGNWQQQTIDVGYDVAGGRLGFSPGGCS